MTWSWPAVQAASMSLVARMRSPKISWSRAAAAPVVCTTWRGGHYFSSRTAWPLSFRSSAITPRNDPVGKSKATTWSWPTQ